MVFGGVVVGVVLPLPVAGAARPMRVRVTGIAHALGLLSGTAGFDREPATMLDPDGTRPGL